MSKIFLKLLRKPTDEDKVAKTPQVAVILKHMRVDHEVSREKLAELVDADGDFNSKQGAARVIQFYTPKLAEAGIVEKRVEATAEDAEKKPKGEKKAKGAGKKKTAGEAQLEDAEPAEEGELVGEDAD